MTTITIKTLDDVYGSSACRKFELTLSVNQSYITIRLHYMFTVCNVKTSVSRDMMN